MPHGPRRTAVLVDITSFDGDTDDEDGDALPADRRRPDPLPFDDVVNGLASTLEGFGYDVRRPREGGRQLAGASIWPVLQSVIDSHQRNDVIVVHVLSHGGTKSDTNSLLVLGRDGRNAEASDVSVWLTYCLDRAEHGPYVLFILDVCYAGQAVRIDDFLRRNQPRNVWILAAGAPEQPVFNARLTTAFENVLRDVLDGRLAGPRDMPLVPLSRFAPAVKARVEELRHRDRGPRQEVHGTTADITTPVNHLPFFPNPRFDPDEFNRDRIPGSLQLSGPIDDRDAAHFIQAAACHGTSASTDPSVFTGRRVELERLAGWLRGPGERRLHLVTGRAGAGKSALLAVLACAAHSALQWHGDELRKRIPWLPSPRPGWRLAAISARHRDVPRCLAAIGIQLFDNPNIPNVDALVEAMLRDGRRAALAVDGLDEAADPQRLMDELLLPLLKAEGAGGRPACAVLVAARHDTDVATAAAQHAGPDVTNLNPVTDEDRRRLETDLAAYVTTLLGGSADSTAGGTSGGAADGAAGGSPRSDEVRQALASAVAARLAGLGAEPALGEFLVARLYVDELNRHPPPADVAQARAAGARVPRSLAGVFELDRRLLTYHWLRPVLAAVAFGRGYGVPASAIPALASAVASAGRDSAVECDAPAERSTPTDAEVAAALTVAGAYLRIVPGDEVALYQLFHDGLAEHLRRHPIRAGDKSGPDGADLYRALLGGVAPCAGGGRIWEATSAYVRRHVLRFARGAGAAPEVLTDPRYLLAHKPEPLAAASELARDPTAEDGLRSLAAAAAAVIELEQELPPRLDQPQRRSRLAIEAVRHRRHDLADALLAGVRGALRPRLVVKAALGEGARAAGPAITAIAATTPTVTVWETGEPPRQLPPKVLPSAVTALAVVPHRGGEELAAGCAGGQLWLWPLDATAPRRKLAGHRSPVRAITMLRSRLVSVDGRDIRLWDPEFGDLVQLIPLGEMDVGGIVGATLAGGAPGLVVHARTTAALLDLGTTTWRTRGSWRLAGGFSTVLTVGGAPAVLHWPGEGKVRWLDPVTGRETEWPGDPGRVLAATELPGAPEPAVVTGDDAGRLIVWLLERGSVQELGTVAGPVRCLAGGVVAGQPVIFCGAGDGTVSVWAYQSRAIVGSLQAQARLLAVSVAVGMAQPMHAAQRLPGVATGAGFGGVVLAAPVGEGRVVVHHLPAGGGPPSERTVLAGADPVRIGVLSRDGWAALVVEEPGGRVRAWHPLDGTPLSDTQPRRDAPTGPINALPAATDSGSDTGLTLVDTGFATVDGGDDGTITIRPRGTGAATAVRTIRAHDGAVTAVVVWSDGHRATAASCGDDGRLAVSDLSTGELLAVAELPAPGRCLRILPTVSGSPEAGRNLLVETGDDAICFEYTPSTREEAQ